VTHEEDHELDGAQIDHQAVSEWHSRHDDEAKTLVGAVIGDWHVEDRIRPGKRWRYVLRNGRTGRAIYLQGYELVRQVRATVKNGGTVTMPAEPWRSEDGAA
jgi:hypothetical protein